MDTLQAITAFLTTLDSAMLLAVFGGLIGLGILSVLGRFIPPNYYTKGIKNAGT